MPWAEEGTQGVARVSHKAEGERVTCGQEPSLQFSYEATDKAGKQVQDQLSLVVCCLASEWLEQSQSDSK